jgi:RecQ family ATP-dependent DNA helicase
VQIEALQNKPQSFRHLLTWLLGCGYESASSAYKHLFCDILGWIITPVRIEKLPTEMLLGVNHAYLHQLLLSPQTYDFDTRLCVAALLAWNYETNLKNEKETFSNWLSNLTPFQDVLNNLFPLVNNEFAISTYLEHFGIPSFRPLQEKAVKAIINRESPLIMMPTGGGKSLCYQLPALMFHHRQKALTVVISPLQALMADQVADLEEAGLFFSTYINSNLTAAERRQRLEELRSSNKGLLCISPEQLRSMSIRALLEQRPPVLWVIDEAHCVSQWGHNFRPDYCYIPKFIKELYERRQQSMPMLALLTATATISVVEDIKKLFSEYDLNISTTINGETTRPNLTFEVIPTVGNKEQTLLNQVQQALKHGGSTLVYTTTRKNAEKLAKLLNQSNIDAKYYHGKLSAHEKYEILQAFKSGELNVVVATCAFGMGINRKDVRTVIHHSISSNLEGYVQEVGRAGRDGKPSFCTLLFDPKDADTIFFLQSLNQLSEQDLKNIFISTRFLRNRIHKGASEDWFTGRRGYRGVPIEAYTFGSIESQATWIQQRICSQIEKGASLRDIAVLARRWDSLDAIRLLLEKAGILTCTLRRDGIKLVRNQVTCKLIDQLKVKRHQVLLPDKSVLSWFETCFTKWGRELTEPTVKILLKIARDIDIERGYGIEDLALPISAADILTSVFEFNETFEAARDEDAVLVTTCHGAKGLEFQNVLLLGDGFSTNTKEIESERRLFYVAMTRAKEELVICSTKQAQFVHETGVVPEKLTVKTDYLPERMFYIDLTPGDINLGHPATKSKQQIIIRLTEGVELLMQVNSYKNGWNILTADGQCIGALSKKANAELSKKGCVPEKFNFRSGEVTVKSIYRHLNIDDVSGEIREDWFVVVPQIRVCR